MSSGIAPRPILTAIRSPADLDEVVAIWHFHIAHYAPAFNIEAEPWIHS
jgi:hypothetical protein